MESVTEWHLDVAAHEALDRPVWHALTGPQAALARGAGRALRIDPGYGPFAAAVPGDEAGLAQLFTSPDDRLWLVEAAPPPPPQGTRLEREALLLQLVADPAATPIGAGDDRHIRQLGPADVPAMTALALANRPGPWHAETWRYGAFYGVFEGETLIAMAGERLRPAPGLAEVSGVCTTPAARGRGLARRLIQRVMAGMHARGEVPFLHSYADNAGAIALYRQLGFVPRRELVARVLAPAQAGCER